MNRAVNTMMLLVSIYAALTMEVSTKTILCHTDNHEYFHKQYGGCLPCEKCNPGEEQMNIEEWVSSKPQSVFTKYGPTQCPECVTCRSGFFNNGRAFECKRCKNCTLYNKHEVEPCTSISDTECDGVLTNKGYV
ncbi:hypothetical protein FSP39_024117 [Pinctada imbricata]|uniref:TNFR-Cys domain-containing protein n=1 Tax=Pinctada imbricata TaxID=66713 RepID=A0AA88YFS0_PINIB|nr:hypothetical protein FSP39_024117 [Pinctada imbricata]